MCLFVHYSYLLVYLGISLGPVYDVNPLYLFGLDYLFLAVNFFLFRSDFQIALLCFRVRAMFRLLLLQRLWWSAFQCLFPFTVLYCTYLLNTCLIDDIATIDMHGLVLTAKIWYIVCILQYCDMCVSNFTSRVTFIDSRNF